MNDPGSSAKHAPSLRRLTAAMRHPLLWLALMLTIFFYKEVFIGLRFSPADMLFVANPWHAVEPRSFTLPSNDLRSDETLINYPHRVDIVADIRRFGLPLWQDHTLAGSANTFSLHSLGSFAYPPFLIFLVLSPDVANTIVHLSIPLLAGIAMYLLLGRAVRHRTSRLLGAVAYALNGYIVVWLSAFALSVMVAMLPLGVYLAWRFLEDKAWLPGALFASVLGAVLIFSYPPGAIIFAVLVAVCVFCWWAQDRRERTLPVLRLAVLGLLGVGISMVAVLPTVQELTNYTSHSFRAPTVSGIPLQFLANWVFPNIAGNPIARDWRGAVGNYCEFVAYDGSLPLLLALGGGGLVLYRRLRANPLVIAALVCAVLSVLLTYVDPVLRVVDAHAPFNNLAPARWEFGLEFAIAILAAYALDEVLSRGNGWAAVWMVALGAAAVLASAGVLIWVNHHEFLHVNDFITQDYRVRLALLLADLLALGWVVRGPRRELGAIAAVAIVFVDLFTFGVDFNPAIPVAQMYPTTPAMQYLQANSAGYRVLPAASGGITSDDFNVYGIDVMTGYDHFRDSGYVQLLGDNMSATEKVAWKNFGFLSLGGSLHLDDSVFNALNVKYAYFGSEEAAAPARAANHWRQVYSGPDGVVFENLAVLPKQFLVSGTTATPSPVVHQPLRPDEDHLTVMGAGRLVWSKPYSRDWKITVDGQAVEPEPYMGYFLSAHLPGGTSEINISYQPAAYYQGALISAASLLALAALVGLGLYRRRLASRAPHC